MTFSEGDRVRIVDSVSPLGTVTADRDCQFTSMVGVNWDSGDFAFVNPSKLALAGPVAIPGLSEADRASLATAHRMALDAVAKIAPNGFPNETNAPSHNRTEPGTDVVDWQARAEQAEAGVARVREIHALDTHVCYCGETHGPYCKTCQEDFPCPTITALDGSDG